MISEALDIFSFGVLMIYILTGNIDWVSTTELTKQKLTHLLNELNISTHVTNKCKGYFADMIAKCIFSDTTIRTYLSFDQIIGELKRIHSKIENDIKDEEKLRPNLSLKKEAPSPAISAETKAKSKHSEEQDPELKESHAYTHTEDTLTESTQLQLKAQNSEERSYRVNRFHSTRKLTKETITDSHLFLIINEAVFAFHHGLYVHAFRILKQAVQRYPKCPQLLFNYNIARWLSGFIHPIKLIQKMESVRSTPIMYALVNEAFQNVDAAIKYYQLALSRHSDSRIFAIQERHQKLIRFKENNESFENFHQYGHK
jgi:hypothetical protein